MKVHVVVAVSAQPLPAGVTFDHLAVVITDSAGVAQTARINGADEITADFDVAAAGDGTVVVTAIASDNTAIGTPVSQAFTLTVPATFPQVTTVTVTQ